MSQHSVVPQSFITCPFVRQRKQKKVSSTHQMYYPWVTGRIDIPTLVESLISAGDDFADSDEMGVPRVEKYGNDFAITP